jgi:glycine/D-amino acid oxidase-like deaminating enzyme
MVSQQTETLVIGGGIIGVSIAYGLRKKGSSVILLDNEDQTLTASRANFGLVWVQGKGSGMQRYVDWCLEAVKLWPGFSMSLEEETGLKLNYEKTGGFEICLGDEEFANRVSFLEDMKKQSPNGQYECQMLAKDELQEMLPKIILGDEVSGASYCVHDGIVDPLNLLRAFYQGFSQRGGNYHPDQKVVDIQKDGSGFLVKTQTQQFKTQKLVIASGLGTTELAKLVGMKIPVNPQKGQVLVTERTAKLFPYATGTIRQNANGSFMFGASHEDTGFEVETTTDILQTLISRALRTFPILKNIQLVRTWAALRVLTPDQKPVYCESEECSGAFALTSHSGVSLAPLHSEKISKWVLEGEVPPDFESFHPRRFNV